MTSVMLVEDDSTFLDRFCRIVVSDPVFELFAAVGTLAAARQALLTNAPDVLITDLGLPDGNGIGTSHWILHHFDYFAILVVCFQVACFFALAWQRRGLQEILLAVAAPWCLVDGLWEAYLPYPVDWISVVNYTFLPHFAVMGWILIQRFARSLNESEQLNAQLEQRVEQKQAELQSHFQRVQQLERDQAIAEERGRIMSDMHDGIGAQLISTLGLAELGTLSQPEMAAALRECWTTCG